MLTNEDSVSLRIIFLDMYFTFYVKNKYWVLSLKITNKMYGTRASIKYLRFAINKYKIKENNFY